MPKLQIKEINYLFIVNKTGIYLMLKSTEAYYTIIYKIKDYKILILTDFMI